MAISKVILNSETLIDVTADTVEANKLLSEYQATKNDGTKVTGAYTAPTYSSQTKSVSPTVSSMSLQHRLVRIRLQQTGALMLHTCKENKYDNSRNVRK